MEDFGSIMLWPKDDDFLLQELLNVSPFSPLEPQQPFSSSRTIQEAISTYSSPSNDSGMMLPNHLDSTTSQCQDISRTEGLFQMTDTKQSSIDKVQDYKYTLRIKSCDAAADDGYKWRKYGQKTIKNSPHPRSYYRCTNPRCGAKKQVELSSQEPGTFIITYEGLHLHYAFPLYPLDENNTQFDQPLTKKRKKYYSDSLEATEETSKEKSQQETEHTKHYPTIDIFEQSLEDHQKMENWGLLEDVVPLKIRQPTSTTIDSNSNSCSSSYPSTPSSPSIFSDFLGSQFYVPF